MFYYSCDGIVKSEKCVNDPNWPTKSVTAYYIHDSPLKKLIIWDAN